MTLTAVPPQALQRGRVLVVDGVSDRRREVVQLLLRNGFVCDVADDAQQAARRLATGGFELLLADAAPPGEDCLALVQHVAAHCPDVAVVVVTDEDDAADLGPVALTLGASGAASRPLRAQELVAHLVAALRRRQLEGELRHLRTARDQEARRRAAAFAGSAEDTVSRLVRAVARRSGHAQRLERVTAYSVLLARAIGQNVAECELLGLASPLYDVGLLALREDEAESDVTYRHALLGHEILAGTSSEVLELAAAIALTHHEWFDGTGGPRRLGGADIPMAGRIVAIADLYERLSATPDQAHRDTMQRLRALRGRQLDPTVLDAFFDVMDGVLVVGGAA